MHLEEARSAREIADLEVLALSTVKWYIQQIYSKLGVNNRRQALERARCSGLLAGPAGISPSEGSHAEACTAQLPTGTVTFLYTDIQGSTPRWEREPQKMPAALQIHNTLPAPGDRSPWRGGLQVRRRRLPGRL